MPIGVFNPRDLEIVTFYDDGFLNSVYFARRKEVLVVNGEFFNWSMGRKCLGKSMMVDGHHVQLSSGYVSDYPEYTYQEDMFSPLGLPIVDSRRYKQQLETIVRLVKKIYFFHVNQGIRFKCSKSVTFDDISDLFCDFEWVPLEQRINASWIWHDWMDKDPFSKEYNKEGHCKPIHLDASIFSL